jgi:nucleotide-binding universal stress UspA family protein
VNRIMKTRSNHFRPKVGLSAARRKPAHQKSKTVWLCKSLIVPVDFSEESERAIDWAVHLAKQTGVRVVLVHFIERRRLFNDRAPVYQAWDKCVIADAKDRLTRIALKKSTGSIRVQIKIRVGQPASELSSMARSFPGSLIVIGTHGFTGLKHLLLGSTAEHVARLAPVPVLVFRSYSEPNGSALLKPKNILVPTDFSKCSAQAMRVALKFAKRIGADLQILHVLPSIRGLHNGAKIDGALLNADLKQAGQQELDLLIKTLSAKCVSPHTFLRHGDPGRQIALAAKDFQSDLIIISSRGNTGLRRVMIGSTTEKVVRHAQCPVLVVPAAINN